MAASRKIMLVYFTLLLALFSMTSMRAGRVLLALYALNLGAHPLTIGLLASTFSVLPMMFSLQAGKLADRFGSRWLLTFGALGSGLGMLVPAGLETMTSIFIAAAMSGLSITFYNISLQNLVGLLSEPDTRARHFSNYSLILSTASFLGPLFIGFTIDHFGYRVGCLCLTGLSFTPAVLLGIWGSALPGGTRVRKAKGGGARSQIKEPGVWRLLAAGALVQSGLDMFQFYMPVYGHSIALSAAAIGVIVAMYSAAAFVVRSAIPYLLERFSETKVLAYAFFVGAAAFLLVPFFKSALLLGLIAFVFGLGMGCGQPITMMMMYSSSAEGRSGEALGLRMTANHTTRVVGPVIFGWLGTMFGLASIFWVNAMMLITGGALSRSVGGPRKGD